jgi:hypothetical protein
MPSGLVPVASGPCHVPLHRAGQARTRHFEPESACRDARRWCIFPRACWIVRDLGSVADPGESCEKAAQTAPGRAGA